MTTPVTSPTSPNMMLIARIIYILYLVSIFTGVTTIIGVVIAYVYGDSPQQEWLKEHLRFQRRTFWIGLFYIVVSTILCIVFIGYLLLLLTTVWLIIRCIRGWKALEEQRAPNAINTWFY